MATKTLAQPSVNVDVSVAKTVAVVIVGVIAAAVALYASWILTPEDTIANDVYYYWYGVVDATHNGFRDSLIEYPLPAAIVLWLPTLVLSTFPSYFTLFWMTSAAICIAIAFLLAFSLPTRKAGLFGAYIWLISVAAAGPLGLFRFDLIPGLLLLVALLSMVKRHSGWSIFVALGTGMKLWPIVALPFGYITHRHRKRELWGFVMTGASLVVGSLMIAGWDRLISPLTWQGVRGLHVESVLSSWILLARLIVGDHHWISQMSDNNSYDFFGPGVQGTLVFGTVAQVAFAAFWAYLVWRFWRSETKQIVPVALATTAVVALLLATNKVFSPQYILWLLPVAAATIALGDAGGSRLPRWWTPGLIYIALMTQLVYPTFYWLIFADQGLGQIAATLALVSRNILLVLLAISVSRRALSTLA